MVSHPASTSHRSLAPAERGSLGISEGLVRVSVEIEDLAVIQEEFRRLLAEPHQGITNYNQLIL